MTTFAKRIIKSVGFILLIIVCCVSAALIYRAAAGMSIRHYKQYVFPCQGRILGNENIPLKIMLRIADEKEISEISSKENILSVEFVTSDGETVEAYDWETKDSTSAFYSGELYFMKDFTAYMKYTKKATLVKLQITYPDKIETFDIGRLDIDAAESLGYLGISPATVRAGFDNDIKKKFANQQKDYYFNFPTMLNFRAKSTTAGREVTLIGIDIGVPGVGVDMSTLKYVSGVSWNEEMQESPDNKAYITINTVAAMPDQTCDIKIPDRETVILLALVRTPDFDDSIIFSYYAPVFIYKDIDGVERRCGANMLSYNISGPHINSDELVKRLLEEKGQ